VLVRVVRTFTITKATEKLVEDLVNGRPGAA
jgi:hypothetical protein